MLKLLGKEKTDLDVADAFLATAAVLAKGAAAAAARSVQDLP